MRPRALTALTLLLLPLTACSVGGGDAGARGLQQAGSTAAATTSRGLRLASPTPTPGVASPPAQQATPGTPGTPPRGTVRLGEFTLMERQPVPDPQRLLRVITARTDEATTYRLGVGGGTKGTYTTTGTVDRSDAGSPKADVWWFEKGSPNGVHTTLIGDQVYTRFPKQGARYMRTPLKDLPPEIRQGLEMYLHPMRELGASDLAGARVELSAVDMFRARPEYTFMILSDDGRPSYQHSSYVQFSVDSDLRLLGVSQYDRNTFGGYLRLSDYGAVTPIQSPPAHLVVDLPGRSWRDALT